MTRMEQLAVETLRKNTRMMNWVMRLSLTLVKCPICQMKVCRTHYLKLRMLSFRHRRIGRRKKRWVAVHSPRKVPAGVFMKDMVRGENAERIPPSSIEAITLISP